MDINGLPRSKILSRSRNKYDIEKSIENEALNEAKFPRRYVLCILTFLGVLLAFSSRANLTIAIVVMTQEYPVTLENGTTIMVKDFDWSPLEKGYIMSSFFLGYILSEFVYGLISSKYGGVPILGAGILLSSVFTFALPYVACYGPNTIAVFRALVGVFEGGVFPCTQAIWSRWAPPEERTRLVAISLTGCHVGSAISLPIYGILAKYFGWPLLFYAPGIAGLLWAILWFTFVRNDPADDPWISESELKYLQSTLKTNSKEKVFNPWKKIFTSMPVWTIVFGYFAVAWVHFTMFTYLPTFLDVLWKVDVELIGFLSCLPHISASIITPIVGMLSDYAAKNMAFAPTRIRKTCHLIAAFGSALFVLLAPFPNSPLVSVVFFTLMNLCLPFSFGSLYVNPLDISPNHASIIMGIASTAGCLAGISAPWVTGIILSSQSDITNKLGWILIFAICSAVSCLGGTFYLIFGSAELQPWANYRQ